MPPRPLQRRAANGAASQSSPAAATSVFDVSELDNSIDACQDFNGFVNAKWVAANPIPSDTPAGARSTSCARRAWMPSTSWSRRRPQNADSAKAGSIEQKIGDLYKSGMDVDAIEQGRLRSDQARACRD